MVCHCRWHCEYGPKDFSGIIKKISADLLPRARKKFAIAKVVSVVEEESMMKSQKKMRNRKASRKFKPKPTIALDLNAPPLSELDAPKAIRKRVSKLKVSPSVTESQCPKGSNGFDTTWECHNVSTQPVQLGGRPRKGAGVIVQGQSPQVAETGAQCAPPPSQAQCHECPPKAVQKRGPRQNIMGNVVNEPPVPTINPCFPEFVCEECVQGVCEHLSLHKSLPKTPPRRECLPDLNVTPLLAKSHHNTVLMKTHSACKGRVNVGKEGVLVFQELRELLNTLTDTSDPMFAGAVGVQSFPSCSISDNDSGSVTDVVADVRGPNLAHPTGLRSPQPTATGRSSCTSHSLQCSIFINKPNNCHSFADNIADGDSANCLVCKCKGTKSTSITSAQGGDVTNNDHIYKASSSLNGDIILDDVKVEGPPQVKPRDSRKQWGMSIKRGCQARFTVKIMLHAPHIVELCVHEERHINKDGVVVHGGLKVGDRGAISAHLSPIIRKFVDDCLRENYTVHQIMKKHLKFLRKWQADGNVITRDLLITPKDIRNISRKLARETWMLHPNDAQSVRMWVQKNPDKVFHYTETNAGEPLKVEGQLDGGNMPFTIGIQTPWQVEMMAKFGHGGGMSIDATFGTNDKKVSH